MDRRALKMSKVTGIQQIGLRLSLFFLFCASIYAQEAGTNSPNSADEFEDYLDFGEAEGITVFAERATPEFPQESLEARVLTKLNDDPLERTSLIEDEFLAGAGFRRTANVKFRKTNGKEKALSVAQGVMRAFSFGAVPAKPYLEVDYARLPTGAYYSFDAVIAASEFNKLSPDVRTILELEYMLQVEFSGGIVGQHNSAYYTEDNIKKFQELAQRLPNSPDSILQVKNRYLDTELKKIQAAFERHKNPSPDAARALQNLKTTLENL